MIAMILLIIVILIIGLFWFDYLGLLDLKSFMSPALRLDRKSVV